MKTQSGFTLIELLVVIAILPVLLGVTALALNGVGSNAATVTASAEKDVVQTAIDTYMAVHNTDTITANASAKLVGPNGTDLFSSYLRRTSKYQYAWTSGGVISQQTP
jgi:prepilin-type N-terminal cleavage/methylation domain-containing protein